MESDRTTADLARPIAEDIEQILALNRLVYGPEDILANPADFNWRYRENPAGEAVIPVIRNALGVIVGFIWVVPVQMRIQGRDWLGAMGTNLVIHPDYRHTFGYVKLMRRFEKVFRDRAIPFHFSFISEETYQQLRANPASQVTTVPFFIKPFDPAALPQYFFTSKWPHLLSRSTARLFSPLLTRELSIKPDPELTITIQDSFTPTFDLFWQQVRDKYPAMLIRNQSFLAWRFAPVSNRHYQIVVAQHKGQMAGYAVLRCTTIRNLKTGLILDLLVEKGPTGMKAGLHLLAEAEAYFQAEGMLLGGGLMVEGSAEYQLLWESGYRLLPAAILPRIFRYGFFFHGHPSPMELNMSLSEEFISLADYESF